MKNAADYVPYGYENAKTRTELMQITGMTDRAIREDINRSTELIVNLQDGKGYFKPLPSEIPLVRQWMMLFTSRIEDEKMRLRKADRWIYAAEMCEYMCPEPEDD